MKAYVLLFFFLAFEYMYCPDPTTSGGGGLGRGLHKSCFAPHKIIGAGHGTRFLLSGRPFVCRGCGAKSALRRFSLLPREDEPSICQLTKRPHLVPMPLGPSSTTTTEWQRYSPLVRAKQSPIGQMIKLLTCFVLVRGKQHVLGYVHTQQRNPLLYPAPLLPTKPIVGVGNHTETAAEITEVFKQANSELKAAQKILIVGGGPIGIEMAGEIMEEMPGKAVTLVTSNELMPSPTVALPDKFRNRLRKKLEQVQ